MTTLNQLREEESGKKKYTTQVLVYLKPQGKPEDHSLCKSCRMWEANNKCSIHGDVRVGPEFSCNLYVNGKPGAMDKVEKNVTPQESGLSSKPVQCQRCKWFGDGKCGLFEMLNKSAPDTFNLDEKVDPNGCCNGWVGK